MCLLSKARFSVNDAQIIGKVEVTLHTLRIATIFFSFFDRRVIDYFSVLASEKSSRRASSMIIVK